MKARITSRVSITDSAKEVFKYLTDTSYHFLWNPHLQTLSSTEELKLGMTYESTSLLLGVRIIGKNQVTDLVPNKKLQIENRTGTVKYIVTYLLSSNRNTTTVVCTTEVLTDIKAFAFSAPVLRALAKRELQSDLNALKIAVEQKLQ